MSIYFTMCFVKNVWCEEKGIEFVLVFTNLLLIYIVLEYQKTIPKSLLPIQVSHLNIHHSLPLGLSLIKQPPPSQLSVLIIIKRTRHQSLRIRILLHHRRSIQ